MSGREAAGEPKANVFDEDAAEALRRAFATRAPSSTAEAMPDSSGGAQPTTEEVWRAVSGELGPDAVRNVLDAAVSSPELSESWLLAVSLRDSAANREAAAEGKPVGGGSRFPWISTQRLSAQRWLLAAAATLACVVGGTFFLQRPPAAPPVYRGAEARIATELDNGAIVPRSAPVLVWSSDLDAVSWSVRVTDPGLKVVAEAKSLEEPRFDLSPELVAQLAPDSELLWQVEAQLPDGTRIPSKTFVVRVP